MRTYDAIIVGLGAMGSATLYHLSKRGKRVLGLEQFAPGHHLGSSHGDSRVIREQYFEHPLYVPLVQRAYELWRALEESHGRALMTINGGLMIGQPAGMVVSGTIRSATEYNLPHEIFTGVELHARYPAFRLADGLVAVLDPHAGYLDPEACNSAHIELARRAGAEVHFEEPVAQWTPDGDGVQVTTARGSYRAGRLLLSGGAWTQELLRGGDVTLPLAVERQVAFWLQPEQNPQSFDRSCFPIYAYEFTPGLICYGFPRLPRGVKSSIMHGGEIVSSPEAVRRTVDDDEIEPVRDALRAILPELAEALVTESSVCLFTNTPDHDFVVDFHPRYPQVLISSPCSGHGFKFASALGEVQADLLTGGTSRFDVSPFRIERLKRA
ncbi:MAG: N-methyl-L-tryptophan oxidase [Gemmatimonadota bacterium]|nr:N-methyl-L-tryptophan oxidase [Gemmatimonadota bacterium]